MSKFPCVKKMSLRVLVRNIRLNHMCLVYSIVYLCERKVAYISVVACMGDNSISVSRKSQVLRIGYLKSIKEMSKVLDFMAIQSFRRPVL